MARNKMLKVYAFIATNKCRTTDELLDFCMNKLGSSRGFCFDILHRLSKKGLVTRRWTEKNGKRMRLYCIE